MVLATLQLTDSGLRFVDLDEQTRAIIRQQFAVGEIIDCELKKHADGRSAQQQRLLHALIHRYSLAMGIPAYIVKWRWKHSYGEYRTWEDMQRDGVPMWKGEFVSLADLWPSAAGIVFLKSEAEYSTREEKDLIDNAMNECMENGVDVSDIVKTLTEHESASRRQSGRPES